ncbi:autotransporter outer membrane beta-barrel domain-containing protein [Haemophilus haemolyticus]|uniref:autotransporter outer membrane beta-barrel domain-containing protein n=1 Tax=Haemophilus haemolyticus TaxID=726 RepID=UPI000E58B74F|nr:autotransporter outer membrane beta-barrel domain-containing protein [Haemophilus haemolyticus]
MAFLAISPNYSFASQIPQITEGEHAAIHKSRQDNVADDPLFKIESGKSAVVNGASDIDLGANEHLARLNGGTLELKAEKTAPGRINFADGSNQVSFGDNKSIVKIENYHLSSEEQSEGRTTTKTIFSATNGHESHELHLNNVSAKLKNLLIDYRNNPNAKVFIKNDKAHEVETKGFGLIYANKGEINGGTYIGDKVVIQAKNNIDFTINNATLRSSTVPIFVRYNASSINDHIGGKLTINDSVITVSDKERTSDDIYPAIWVPEFDTTLTINRSTITGGDKTTAVALRGIFPNGQSKPTKIFINDSLIDTGSAFGFDGLSIVHYDLSPRTIELSNTIMTDKVEYILRDSTGYSQPHAVPLEIIAKNNSKLSGAFNYYYEDYYNRLTLKSHSEWKVKENGENNGFFNQLKKLTLDEGKVYFAKEGVTLKVIDKVSGNGIFGLYADLSTDDVNLAKNTLTFQEGWEGNFEVEIYDVGDGSFKKAHGKQLINIPQNNDAHATFYRRHLKGVEELVLRKCPTGWCTYVKPRTESVVYAANSEAANNMFTLRLHDRLGNVFMQPNKSQAVWLRTIRSTHDQQLIGGESTLQGTRNGVQLGGNLYHKQTPHGNVLAGLMAGYAKYQSTAVNHETGIVANGRVKGYSLGVYGTWYQNNEDHTGAYIDSWLNYNWFKNRVSGNKFREEYGSRGLTASIEAGYNFLVSDKTAANGNQYRVYIQPQLQTRYMAVKGHHVEQNGTQIKPLGQDNLQSRAGIKAYLDAKFMNHIEVAPFVAINSLYQNKGFGVSMDGEKRLIDNNKKAFEFEMGADVKLKDKVKLWASFATQSGKHRDKNKQGQMGLKFEF